MSDNRLSVKSSLEAALQRVLQIDDHRDAIVNSFAEMCKFRNELLLQATESGGTVTLNFTNTEVILLNCNNNDCVATINLTDINTTTFYLIVQQKTANFSISNADDITPNPDVVKAYNYVVYRIEKYGVSITYEALKKTVIGASEPLAGIAKIATLAAAKDETNNEDIITPARLNTVARLGFKLLTNNPGSTYSVEGHVGYIAGKTLDINVKVIMPNHAANAGRQIRISNIIGTNYLNVYQNNGTKQIVSIATNAMYLFQCDGTQWWVCNNLGFFTDLLACPFIYINDIKFDEILRNYKGSENNKIDILDISNQLDIGTNKIRISEEKDEKTYIEYFKAKINDKEIIFFDKQRLMTKGDFYEFEIKKENENDKIELIAKGYYVDNI